MGSARGVDVALRAAAALAPARARDRFLRVRVLTPQKALGIRKGEPLVLRYRFWVHDGPGDRAKADSLWKSRAEEGR